MAGCRTILNRGHAVVISSVEGTPESVIVYQDIVDADAQARNYKNSVVVPASVYGKRLAKQGEK